MEKIEELKEYTLEEYIELRYGNEIVTHYGDEYGYDIGKHTIFAIPDYRVPYLYYKLEPYFKKAEKFNVPYIMEEIGKVDLKDDENKVQHCIIIKLEFEIQFNGWKFIAAIDHLPNGNIIRNISGADLPEKFRTADSYCEHCNTKRRRKATYVVYSETEGYKQVGKNCLFLYTGIDLNKIASAMDIWNYVHTYSAGGEGEYDPDYTPIRASKSCDARDVLAIAWKLVRVFGYSKKGNANSTISRYNTAINYLDGTMKRYNGKEYIRYKKFLEENKIEFLTEEDYEMADTIIKWVKAQKTSSEYINNLQVILSNYENYERIDPITLKSYTYKSCFMDKKYINMVISSISAYNKTMDILSERKLKHDKEMESKHIGTVGEKIAFILKDIKVLASWENRFGYRPTTTYMYKLTDEKGNVCIWQTNTVQDLKTYLEKTTTVNATVKEHSIYNGVNQTVLTYCKFKGE